MNLLVRRGLNRVLGGLIAIASILPSSAFAWGEAGHRITGLIAERLLTKEAADGVKALMGNTDLATASLYMDQKKDELSARIPRSDEWHYDDKPVCKSTAKPSEYCATGDCASNQIVRHIRVLEDDHSTTDQKRFALYVLVHVIGDIHQPLHASDNRDRGGNGVKVRFKKNDGQPRTTKLHSAWDTDFLRAAFDETDERKIADAILGSRTAASSEIKNLQTGDATTWLAESYGIAQSKVYGKLPGFKCTGPGLAGTIQLTDSYVSDAKIVIPTRLMSAGARIAAVLNATFADTEP